MLLLFVSLHVILSLYCNQPTENFIPLKLLFCVYEMTFLLPLILVILLLFFSSISLLCLILFIILSQLITYSAGLVSHLQFFIYFLFERSLTIITPALLLLLNAGIIKGFNIYNTNSSLSRSFKFGVFRPTGTTCQYTLLKSWQPTVATSNSIATVRNWPLTVNVIMCALF